MSDNKTLRANARAQLGNNIFDNAWLTMLAACLVYEAVIGATSSTLVGALLLTGPLTYGLYRMMIGVVCGKKADWNDALTGFKESFGNSLVLSLLQSVFLVLWTLLFIIPGIIKAFSLSQVFYILLNP